MVNTRFSSQIFPVQDIDLDGRMESVLVGGRHLLALLPEAWREVDQIAVIGWGSQGPAQAANLRDSLAGGGPRVTVGLRRDSSSMRSARSAGFREADGSLGEMFEMIARADLVLLLISDGAQAELHAKVFEALQPGATLGLSHGFLVGYLCAVGDDFPDDINVIGVCPKGMGPSVRRLYQQGAATSGAGINCSFAVEQDIDRRATDMALAWAVGIGAPYTFKTTLSSEYRSDIFGERAVLLGAVHGLVESLYRWRRDNGADEEDAFVRACETITGPIAATISRVGLIGLFNGLERNERDHFARAYSAAYEPVAAILSEIYDEVDSARELAGVIAAGERLKAHPMAPIEGTRMWQVGATIRASRAHRNIPIDGIAAGAFAAAMTAQVDLLRRQGHPWSEVANESVIEAVDSLIPFMHARGVAYMVDNCSTTARLGARRWGPVFEAAFSRVVLPALDQGAGPDPALMEAFRGHTLHQVLATLSRFRPPLDIAVE